MKNHIKQYIRWIKKYESKDLEDLKSSFGGGRPSKLTYNQPIEFDKIIDETLNMSMKDLHRFLIKNTMYITV